MALSVNPSKVKLLKEVTVSLPASVKVSETTPVLPKTSACGITCVVPGLYSSIVVFDRTETVLVSGRIVIVVIATTVDKCQGISIGQAQAIAAGIGLGVIRQLNIV